MNVAQIYSTLGSSTSLVPMAIKDVSNSMGLTAGSYMVGDKVEGKDRFIDEFGTQGIWLLGIPFFKKVIDKTVFKLAKLNPDIDVRILKNKNILKKSIENAPTDVIKAGLEAVSKKQTTFKALNFLKFGIATAATVASYVALTKYRHASTKAQIEKEFLEKEAKKTQTMPHKLPKAFAPFAKDKNVSFTGLQNFILDPVKNMMVVDGFITGERLVHSRNPQDFMGYVVKEGAFWGFMYFAKDIIQSVMEKYTDKKFDKSIALDSKLLENKTFMNSFKNDKIVDSLKKFPTKGTEEEIFDYIIKNPDNWVVKAAKKSGLVQRVKNKNLVDTSQYIDTDKVKKLAKNIEKLHGQYKESKQPLTEFFGQVKTLKRNSILKNMGICVLALGVLVPAIMIGVRYMQGDKDFQVKKDIEEQLKKKHKTA